MTLDGRLVLAGYDGELPLPSTRQFDTYIFIKKFLDFPILIIYNQYAILYFIAIVLPKIVDPGSTNKNGSFSVNRPYWSFFYSKCMLVKYIGENILLVKDYESFNLNKSGCGPTGMNWGFHKFLAILSTLQGYITIVFFDIQSSLKSRLFYSPSCKVGVVWS